MSGASDWTKPQQVDDPMVAFPANVCGTLLPPMDEIPDEFKERPGTKWNRLGARWFFSGLNGRIVWKDGINERDALRHLKACLGSWEPKHEHKEAGVAYLFSLWAERFEEEAP